MMPSVRTISDLLLQGRTHEDITRELYALDQRVFPGMPLLHAGVPEVWVDQVRYHQPNYRVMVDGGRLVGYWHVAPLTEPSFARLLHGDLADGEIELDDVQLLDQPGEYDLYFLVIAVDDEFRGPPVKLLLDAFGDYLADLARDGFYFRRLCANVFTPDGERLFRRAGMIPGSMQDGGGQIFSFEMPAMIDWFKRLSPELGERYERHFQART